MTFGGFVIVVRNKSFIDSKQYSLEPTYLLTALKTLVPTKRFISCDGNDHENKPSNQRYLLSFYVCNVATSFQKGQISKAIFGQNSQKLVTNMYKQISRGIIKSLLCLSSISNNMSDTRFRLVVMGDSYVGKSSIIKRFLHGTFDINYVATGMTF